MDDYMSRRNRIQQQYNAVRKLELITRRNKIPRQLTEAIYNRVRSMLSRGTDDTDIIADELTKWLQSKPRIEGIDWTIWLPIILGLIRLIVPLIIMILI